MVDTLLIIREARECLKTPYQHQGRLKGVGLDCVGLVVTVAKAAGISLVGFVDRPYGPMSDGKALIAELNRFTNCIWSYYTTPDKPFQPLLKNGDIVLLAWTKTSNHIGFVAVSNYGWNIIHSYSGCSYVTEHSLDAAWLKRVRGVYRFKDVI